MNAREEGKSSHQKRKDLFGLNFNGSLREETSYQSSRGGGKLSRRDF